jgi:hypothetical protein
MKARRGLKSPVHECSLTPKLGSVTVTVEEEEGVS